MGLCAYLKAPLFTVIPAAFHSSLSFSQKQTLEHQNPDDSTNDVLIISRGTSIILLFVYAAYRAYFQPTVNVSQA
jgi:hypothetical protein